MRIRQIVMAAVAFLMLGSMLAGAQRGKEQPSYIVYTDSSGSVVLTAPEAWVLDPRAVAFHPAGTQGESAPAIIYVKTVAKKGYPTLQSFIDSDVERAKTVSPGARVTAEDPLPTARGTKAPVNHFSGLIDGNVESHAYVEAPSVYVKIVLSSNDEAAQKKAYAALSAVLKSYHFSTVTGGAIRK